MCHPDGLLPGWKNLTNSKFPTRLIYSALKILDKTVKAYLLVFISFLLFFFRHNEILLSAGHLPVCKVNIKFLLSEVENLSISSRSY